MEFVLHLPKEDATQFVQLLKLYDFLKIYLKAPRRKQIYILSDNLKTDSDEGDF